MSCEDETTRLNEIREQARRMKEECDALEFQHGDPSHPEVVSCRVSQYSLEAGVAEAERDLESCRKGMQVTGIREVDGRLTFLRINEVRTGYGGGDTNRIDAEVIFKLDTEPNMGFGFQLRNDEFFPSRQGMLSLLRDAYHRDLELRIDYIQTVKSPQRNVIAIRVALIKPPPNGRTAPSFDTLELG